MEKLTTIHNRLVKQGVQRQILTPQEQALLDRQQHVDFGELSAGEQRRMKAEIDSMFGQIPAHLQEKARGMAGMS